MTNDEIYSSALNKVCAKIVVDNDPGISDSYTGQILENYFQIFTSAISCSTYS